MKLVAACQSDIHGVGICVRESVKRGDLILHIKGKTKLRVNRTKREALAYPNWIGIGQNRWIDPEKPVRFINHSCNPNAGIRGKVSLVALCAIKAGEELTLDYSTVEEDPRWELRCSCTATNCRGIVRSIHFLPEKQFKQYLPCIPAYFQRIHRKSGR